MVTTPCRHLHSCHVTQGLRVRANPSFFLTTPHRASRPSQLPKLDVVGRCLAATGWTATGATSGATSFAPRGRFGRRRSPTPRSANGTSSSRNDCDDGSPGETAKDRAPQAQYGFLNPGPGVRSVLEPLLAQSPSWTWRPTLERRKPGCAWVARDVRLCRDLHSAALELSNT
jgi:hypothetical protein